MSLGPISRPGGRESDVDGARGPSPLAYALQVGTVGGGVVGLMIAAAQWYGVQLFLASWASSTALVLTSPGTPASRPKRIVLGHVLSAAAGLLVHAVMPSSPWSLGLSVGLALVLIIAFDAVHPPAVTNAVLAFAWPAPPQEFLLVASAGGVVLACLATSLEALRRWRS